MALLSRLSHIGIAKETVIGTPVAPTVFLPVMAPKPEDKINPLRDESIRGADATLSGMYPGAASSTFGFDTMLYPALFGNLLRAIIGPDTISGVGPYTHLFKAGARPSYTITDYNAFEARAYPGCVMDELTIKIDVKGNTTASVKFTGFPSVVQPTSVPSFSTAEPLLGWQYGVSAGGVASNRHLSADISFKRDTDVIAASTGLQSPREIFAGPLEVTVGPKVIFEDRTDLDRFLTYAQNAFVASLTQPTARGGASLAVTLSKAAWPKATVERGDKYVTLDADIEGITNTIDGGPAAVTLVNAQATAY